MSEPAAPQKDRQRSPQYPVIDLEKAVERIAVLYKEDKGAAATPVVIAEHWKFSAKSSGFIQTIASLKRFGLLDEIETPGDRRLKLSRLAIDIVLLGENDTRRAEAIKKAALMPKVHLDLWKEFHLDLPSDSNLLHHLISVYGFKHDAAKDVVGVYKKTITFAKLTNGDKIGESDGGADNGSAGDAVKGLEKPFGDLMTGTANTGSATTKAPPKPAEIPAANPTVRDFAIPLDNGAAIIMRVPLPLNAEDFATLLGTLKLWKKKFIGDQTPMGISQSILDAAIVDVSELGEEKEPGVFILPEFNEATDTAFDYRDLRGKNNIRSIGRNKKTGVVLAAIDGRFYENEEYDCIWLR